MSISQTVLDAPPSTSSTPAPRAAYRAGLALAVIVTCQLMLVLDGTVVNIALPEIQRALHFSAAGLAWVLNAYMLAFGGLLLLGGRAGDILGRRRVFVAGIALFTLASLLGGLAPTAGLLVAARAAQGFGAAFAAPSALAFIAATFPEGPRRNRALALLSAVASAGGSLGLLLGGVLTSWVSWRWVLFINVPVGIAVVLLAPHVIREPARRVGRLDVGGALTSTAGMAALVYGFLRASSAGWTDRLTLGAFALALILLPLFLAVEARVAQPLMPLRLFADRNRAAAYLNMLLFFATLFGVFFFLTQFLQDVLGFRPMRAGLAFLPMTLAMFSTVRTVPRLLPHYGPKRIMVVGATLIAAGIAGLAQITAASNYAPNLVVPMLLLGVGIGSSILPLSVVILAGVGPEESGAASGALQTMQQVGGSLGLALLVTVFGAARRAAGAGGPAATSISMAHGVASAFSVATLFAVTAVVVALFAVRSVPAGAPTNRPTDDAAKEAARADVLLEDVAA